MKILINTSNFPRWEGDSTTPFVLYLAEELQKSGADVHVLAPHFKGAKKYEILKGVKVHRFKYFFPQSLQTLTYSGGAMANLKSNKLNYFLVPFFLLTQLINLIILQTRNRYNIINAHWIIPQGFTSLFIKYLFKIPLVVTVHGSDVFDLKRSFFSKFKEYVLKNADAVTVNSSATKKASYNLYRRDDYRIIPMGIDMKMFKNASHQKKIREKYSIKKEFILYVGRLVKDKGIGFLIKAMPMVLKKFPEAKLLIVGEGKDKAQFKDIVLKLGLDKNVIITGWIDNKKVPAFFATSDVTVVPSFFEGLGIVAVEAIASGSPVIASNVGGIPDIIKHKKTGLLVKPKNSKEIAEALISILSNKESSMKMVKAAQDLVMEKYDWDIITKEFTNLFSSLIDNRK